MLPKVCFSFKDSKKNFSLENIRIKVRVYTNIKAMEKIEDVTCIKFEDRNKNNHKELVQYIITDKEPR